MKSAGRVCEAAYTHLSHSRRMLWLSNTVTPIHTQPTFTHCTTFGSYLHLDKMFEEHIKA